MNSPRLAMLRDLFDGTVTVREIAEPMKSFDASCPSAEVLEAMNAHGYDCVGLRKSGHLIGTAHREEIGEGAVGAFLRPISESPTVKDSASLRTAIELLQDHSFVLVSAFGETLALITRSDLHKPAARLWMFGMISVLEMEATDFIKSALTEDEWSEMLSPGRVQKAKDLRRQRQQSREDLDLVDCLQLCDKLIIVRKRLDARGSLPFAPGEAKSLMGDIEQLRNTLAHGHEGSGENWAKRIGTLLKAERVIDALLALGGERR